jgi:hypothetical protein
MLLVAGLPGLLVAAQVTPAWPPDAELDPVFYLVKRRMEAARSVGGEPAVVDFVREEVRERIYSGDRTQVALYLVNYLRDHGSTADLSVLEKWLAPPPTIRQQPYGSAVRLSHVGWAWYSIRKRLCRSDEDARALARLLVDPAMPAPSLQLGVESVAAELEPYWPESRKWVYATLTTKSTVGRESDWRWTVCRSLLDLPQYAPNRQEIDEITFCESETGVCMLVLWLQGQADERAERILAQCLTRYRPRGLWLLAEPLRTCLKGRREGFLALAIENCMQLLREPITSEREELLAVCMDFGQDVDVVYWEKGRTMFKALCKHVVDTQPVLGDEFRLDSSILKPGANCRTETANAQKWRRTARKRALAFLAWCDEMEPHQVKEGSGQERALAEAPQQKGGSSEDGDSGSKAGRPAAGQSVRPPTGPRTSEGESTPAVRWFIDGREMGK